MTYLPNLGNFPEGTAQKKPQAEQHGVVGSKSLKFVQGFFQIQQLSGVKVTGGRGRVVQGDRGPAAAALRGPLSPRFLDDHVLNFARRVPVELLAVAGLPD